jgi:hypothetical protein
MADKKPGKFQQILDDGTLADLEIGPSTIDMHDSILEDLRLRLMRLKPSEQLKLPSDHLKSLSDSSFERDCVVGETAIVYGCNVEFGRKLSENPTVYGYIFTRRDDLPVLEWAELQGGVH